MNTHTIIGIVVAVVAIIGGYWLYSGGAVDSSISTGEDTEAKASVGRTFAQLLGMGQSMKCTYEYNDGGNVSSGTMYIADGGERLRGEFNFTQSGAGPMQMYMLRVDGFNHMWGSSMPQGIKTRVTAENRTQLFDAADANTTAINNTQYKCEAWSADASMFTVPTDVQFLDMSEMTKMMGAPKIGEANSSGSVEGSATIDVKAMQCGACDQAGPAREQCRQALGCK